jgi:hypothetical protein
MLVIRAMSLLNQEDVAIGDIRILRVENEIKKWIGSAEDAIVGARTYLPPLIDF